MEVELNDSFYDSFAEKGYGIISGFLDPNVTAGILQELQSLSTSNQFKQAGIGKDAQLHVDQAQRGDAIHWIHPETAADNTSSYLRAIDEVRELLNRNFYLGLRDYECHYTEYPVGTFYKKHVDRHKSGSRRMVSFVLYLNENWTTEDGGQLRIWGKDGTIEEVVPSAGKLALFLSELEHEVLPTMRIRNSITGWMRIDGVL